MKILYICNEYPPNLHGGIGSFMRDLAEGLVQKEHEVTIWGLYDGLDNEVIESIKGVSIHRLPYKKIKSRFNLIWFILNLNWKLRVFLKLNKFDIIECQEWQGLLPFGLKANYVIRLHGAAVFFDKLLNRPGNRLMHYMEKLTISKAENLVAVSDYCGKETLKLLNLKKDYKVIYNSINSEKILSFKKDNYKKYSIVFANSMLPKKGIFELAKAFNLIFDKFPNAHLTFVGKLNYFENGINVKDLLLNIIDENKKANVSILGWLDSADDVYLNLANAHVCAYPSHMEGFGIAPVEAMILGKATVFMKNGPGPELIEDKISGFLVNSKNHIEIAEKVIEIFDNSYDLKKIGLSASERAFKLFDKETVFIPNNINYYNSLIKK